MKRVITACTSLFFVVVAATALAAATPAEKWHIKFEGQSTSAGEVHLRVTPQGGDPVDITVKIDSGRGQIAMAKELLASLKTGLSLPQYKSEIIHVETVRLKAGHKQPAFGLELVESTVGGTRVVIAAE
jgi:hypothetical protein